jgi:16S rRNA processing protein RimM
VEFVKIGKVVKRFGVKGMLKVYVEDPYLKTIESCRAFFFNLDGSMVPFIIERRNGDIEEWTIKLKRIDSPEDAKIISGHDVFIEKAELVGSSLVSLDNDLEGYEIHHNLGKKLDVISIETYPKQLMLKCRRDQNGDENILIPLVEDWIESIDQESKVISMELPEGLL